MFRRKNASSAPPVTPSVPAAVTRVSTILGPGVYWQGDLKGEGGVRIEGTVDGDVDLRGLLVVGESGRLNSSQIRANTVVVAGAVRGDITAEKVEIRSTGRVWGNVTAAAFATEEGAFLRGQIQMEEHIALGPAPAPPPPAGDETQS